MLFQLIWLSSFKWDGKTITNGEKLIIWKQAAMTHFTAVSWHLSEQTKEGMNKHTQ
jgi:hypothetical protein